VRLTPAVVPRSGLVWCQPADLPHAGIGFQVTGIPTATCQPYFSHSTESGRVFSHWFDSITPPESCAQAERNVRR